MRTTAVTPSDLAASVIAVPPLARNANLVIAPEENAPLITIGVLDYGLATPPRAEASLFLKATRTGFCEAKFGPYTLIWDEEPTNWVVNRWFSHRRNFRNGPFRFLCATLKMFPEKDGCRVRVLAPVARRVGDKLGLPNFGKKSACGSGPKRL